jgi:hypothetical protein
MQATEKMEVAEEEDQHHPLHRPVPPGILPDQVAAEVEQHFRQDAEDRVGTGTFDKGAKQRIL